MVKTLLNLCDLYSNKVADIVQELLSRLSILDKAPVDGLPKLEDVVEAHAKVQEKNRRPFPYEPK